MNLRRSKASVLGQNGQFRNFGQFLAGGTFTPGRIFVFKVIFWLFEFFGHLGHFGKWLVSDDHF